jgi:uncharacterized protein
VGRTLPDDRGDLAEALLRVMFDEREQLKPMTLDELSAIFTQPVPLHPGAVEFYRAQDGG